MRAGGAEAPAGVLAGASLMRAAGLALGLALTALLAAGPHPAAGADAEEPFEVQLLEGAGRPVDVVAAPRPPGAGPGADVLVVFVTGTPPDEQRRIDLFRAGGGGEGAGPLSPRSRLSVPPRAVAFDVADVAPPPGPEIVLLEADALEIWRMEEGGARRLRRVPLVPPAPLPPRVRGFSHMPLVGDWSGTGAPQALVPSLSGARRVPLDGGEPGELELSILTGYFTPTAGPPPYDGLLETTFEWPRIALGRDTAAGPGPDLFALGRYGVSVFRRGPAGLPRTPSRRMALRPFDPSDELRYEATRARLWARDLDGDGLTDLVVHRSSGRLLGSHADTAVYANPGDGADLARPPEARLEVESGVAEVDLVDLDGDGRVELAHSVVRFGLLQLLRILTRRQVEVELRVYALPASGADPSPAAAGAPRGLGPPREVWRAEISLPLDFAEGRVAGLLPSMEGDWNGDGRRDLLYGTGRDGLAVHLGRAGEDGPRFGGREASQALPDGSASWLRVLDADGDGLDDLVVFDDWSSGAAIHLLRNRGRLPGTAPRMRAHRAGG